MWELIVKYWWAFLLFGIWSFALVAWSWWARGGIDKIHRRNLLEQRRTFIKRV